MNKKNKFITALVLFAIAAVMLAFSASATNTETANEDFGTYEDEALSYEASESEANTEVSPSEINESQIFDQIYGSLLENADKIFAALAFAGTMLISFAYKKGLIPILKNAMSALAGSVEKIRDNGTELARRTDDRFSTLCESMDEMRSRNETAEKSVDSINQRLEALDSVAEQYEKMKVILSSQVDMLYAIFMSSALPQYQKDEVGARIKEMREELEKYEETKE